MIYTVVRYINNTSTYIHVRYSRYTTEFDKFDDHDLILLPLAYIESLSFRIS